jgi:hypothetical protein
VWWEVEPFYVKVHSKIQRIFKNCKEYNDFKMVKCTNKEVFVAATDNIERGKGEVVVSVIKNLLCAVGKTSDPEAMNTYFWRKK